MGEEPRAHERTIRLKKLEVGLSKVLRNLYFDFDKVELKDESLEELNKLERMMTQNPGNEHRYHVGHTDEIGDRKIQSRTFKKKSSWQLKTSW